MHHLKRAHVRFKASFLGFRCHEMSEGVNGIPIFESQIVKSGVYHFTGKYECKVDAKSRFVVPGGVLKQLPENERKLFYVTLANHKPCLELYSESAWKRYTTEKLGELNRLNSEEEDLIDLLLADVYTVELDTANRLLIPKSLIPYAAIESDVLLAPSLDTYKIWSPRIYAEVMGSQLREKRSALVNKYLGQSGRPQPPTKDE